MQTQFTLLWQPQQPGAARITLLEADAEGLLPTVAAVEHHFDTKQVAVEISASSRALARLNRRPESARDAAALATHGRFLFDLVLPSAVKDALRAASGGLLTVVAPDGAVPWCLLHDGTGCLALRWALGELDTTERPRSAARGTGADRLLLVADPSADLPAARHEGEALVRTLSGDGLPCDLRLGGLRRADLLRIFKTYRMVHFAGHADPATETHPAGWRLSDGWLDADAIERVAGGPAPRLVFANACRSGLGGDRIPKALLDAGCRHFIGTYLDVPDLPGAELAARFYTGLRSGLPIGEALRQARLAAAKAGSPIGSAYRLLGDPSAVYFRAKRVERFASGPRRGAVLAIRDTERTPENPAEALEASDTSRRAVRELVAAHGGRLLPGRGAVQRAVFGVPISFENDAIRAAQAALEIARARPSVVVAVAAGPLVSTGADVVGAIADSAERLAWQADTLGVHLVDGLQVLLGCGVEVEGSRLLRLAVEAPPSAPAMVGRSDSLARLMACGDGVEQGAAQFVVVRGQPGIGKTRLCEAFEAARTTRMVRGHVLPYDTHAAFAAFGEIARTLGGIDPNAGDPRGQLRRWLTVLDEAAQVDTNANFLSIDALLSSPTEASKLGCREPALAAAMGLAVDESGEGGEIAVAFVELLRAVAVEAPLVLLIEDVHWLPPAGLSVLEALRDGLDGVGVMVLCTARFDLSSRAQRLFSTGWECLDLQPLKAVDATALLAQLLPAADGLGELAERAEGNPLFLKELALARAQGGPPGAVPATIEGALRGRLDRRPPFEQEVLRAAAIFGRTFWTAGVCSLLGQPERVERALTALEAHRFITVEAHSELADQVQWRFDHALLHAVVAGETERRARRVWHGRAALWFSDELDGASPSWARIAHHREAAGDPLRAAKAWLEVAQAAATGYTPDERRGALEAAIKADDAAGVVLPSGVRAAALEGLGELAQAAGELVEAGAHFDAAIALGSSGSEGAERRRKRAEVDELLGELDAARARLAGARAEVEAHQTPAARTVWTMICRDEAWLSYRDGAYDAAIEQLRLLIEAGGDAALVATVRHLLGVAHYAKGEHDAAERHFRAALAVYTARGLQERISSVCNNLGILAFRQADFEGAIGWYQRSVRINARRGDRNQLAGAYNNLGSLYGERGDYVQAARYLGESIRIRERSGHGNLAVGYANLGEVFLKQGQLDAAESRLARAIALCEAGRGPGYLLPDAWRMLADLHLKRGRTEAAEAAATQALSIAEASGDRPRAAAARRVLGEVLYAGGDVRGAQVVLRRAVESFEDLEQPLELAKALSALAAAQPPDAKALASRADALFDAVGASTG